TMTYISPESGSFGALGHPISDADTGEIIKSSGGNLLDAEIVGVVKGERGLPGEIQGTVKDASGTGTIKTNSKYGVFGFVENVPLKDTVEIASKNQIQLGKALVVTDVAGGEPLPYSAEIMHVSHNADSNKGMVIKITDERLLGITGGIVQGMSGSPLVQNGKLIGAVTHVFVNDPTRGYGIFIENMLAEAKNIR
ncbi:MAG: SpoIVB peptidase, partial [Ruminococcaceae bacterium]|nr:SpoIVB peptidase [Oscillospiraceae bacterium]